MTKWFRKKFINFLVKHLFKVVSEDDFFRVVNGRLIHRNTVLNDGQKSVIIQQAKDLHASSLLQAMLAEMKYVANKRIYHESQSLEDVIDGKLVLFTIDVLEKKIYNLSRLR